MNDTVLLPGTLSIIVQADVSKYCTTNTIRNIDRKKIGNMNTNTIRNMNTNTIEKRQNKECEF